MQLSQIHNRWKLVTGYMRGTSDLDAFPMTLIVENTGKCNLKCPMCPRELGEYENIDFDFDLFKRLIDEVSGRTELVFPWGGGEPLMSPDLFKMVRYCKDQGIYTVVSTNATLLNEERSRRLIEAGLDNLIIAFDGTTKEVYEKYRKNAIFEKVIANIHRFLEIKKEMESDVFVVMQMVRLPDNAHQTRDFYKMWDLEGIDEIRIKEDEIVIEEVALEERIQHDRRRNPCYQLWQGPPTVKYDGDFFPCCHMWRSEPFGNVKNQSIQELWNSPKMQRIRQAHLDGDLRDYPDCANCHAPNPVLPVILGTFMVDMFKVRQWIPKMEKMALFYKIPAFRDR
ncbi:MAG TPA: radical SAM protein [Acidobacteriota bacterium]|nr:radical SAM protein [Acidobacteriota bacterium]